jgi:chorismate dehydratase
MQKKIRVGAVNYLNTKPLIYSFEHGHMANEIELVLDYPSKLASALQKNQLDIALLPIAAMANITDAEIISPYGIASDNHVASVALFSEVPIEEIQEIYLDYQSRTSVALLRILLRDYWRVRPMLLESDENYIDQIKGKTAGIIIGDRALENYNRFNYRYDLSEAWMSHTQLPFVFAAWISNQPLNEDFKSRFNAAIADGLTHIDDIIALQNFPSYDLKTYYTENISYHLDEQKQKGMTIFLKQLALL